MGCMDPIPEQSAWEAGFPLGWSEVGRLSLWVVGRLAGPSWEERGTVKEKAVQGQEPGPGWAHCTEDPRALLAQGWARGWPLKVRAKVSTGGAQL